MHKHTRTHTHAHAQPQLAGCTRLVKVEVAALLLPSNGACMMAVDALGALRQFAMQVGAARGGSGQGAGSA